MNKLKGIMRENGITQQELADKLGISVQSFNAKINGRTAFTVPEAMDIVEFLEIKNPEEIFFSDKIPNTQRNKNLRKDW